MNGSTNNAVSNYNALQALITKRMTYGPAVLSQLHLVPLSRRYGFFGMG